MGIPHVTLDVRERFRREVVENFVSEHVAGRTPNPCIRCNGLVRFGEMLDLAVALGASRLATGHYARIASDGAGPLVRAARSASKDQSYMLCRLSGDELSRLWFPLGDLEKPEVREIARSASLPVAEKAESQDLCFLAGLGAQRFLERHGAALDERFEPNRPGPLVDERGAVLGAHDGQHRFTVGQRRGLGLAAGEPRYVIAKDAATNRVTIGPKEALATRVVQVASARLFRPAERVDRVKLRYRSQPLGCAVVGRRDDGGLSLALSEPARGVAPGQTACLMCGDSVIGWGILAPRATESQQMETTAHAQ